MADNSSNIINPVQGLQNVQGMAPTKHREQRKRRQDTREDTREENQQRPDKEIQDINDLFEDEQPVNNESTENEEEQHEIDYRA